MEVFKEDKYFSQKIIDLTLLNDFSLLISELPFIEAETLKKVTYLCGQLFDAAQTSIILRIGKTDEFKVVSGWDKFNNNPEWIGICYSSDSSLGLTLEKAISGNNTIFLSNLILDHKIVDSLGTFSYIFELEKTYLIPLKKSDVFFGFLTIKFADKIPDNSKIGYCDYIGKILSSALSNSNLYKNNLEIKSYLENMIQNSRDAIISLDLTGKIILWNEGAEDIFGYNEREIIGKNFYYLFSSESRSKISREWIELLTGRVINCADAKGLKKEGNKISVSYTISPIKDTLENVVGMSIIFRDLTAQKNTESHISESKSRLQSVFDNLEDYIILFDLEKNILMANKAAIKFSGISLKKLIGSYSYMILEEIKENDPVELTIKTRRISTIEKFEFQKKIYNLKSIPVLDSIGKITGVILQITDITEK